MKKILKKKRIFHDFIAMFIFLTTFAKNTPMNTGTVVQLPKGASIEDALLEAQGIEVLQETPFPSERLPQTVLDSIRKGTEQAERGLVFDDAIVDQEAENIIMQWERK